MFTCETTPYLLACTQHNLIVESTSNAIQGRITRVSLYNIIGIIGRNTVNFGVNRA